MQDLTIVYDGQCPLCRNYVKLHKASESVNHVELVDARDYSPIRQELSDLGFDLDHGMVVRHQDRLYVGAEAITVLARISRRTDLFNRACFLVFRSNQISSILYPLLRGARNFVLWVLNIPQINNLKKDAVSGDLL